MSNIGREKVYEEPKLIDLQGADIAQGDCYDGSSADTTCGTGTTNTGICLPGTGAAANCSQGNSASGTCVGGNGGN